MHLCKTKTKLADFKKPTYSKKVKKQYGEDESKYPDTVTAEMKTRLSEWEAKTTAQAEKRKRITSQVTENENTTINSIQTIQNINKNKKIC